MKSPVWMAALFLAVATLASPTAAPQGPISSKYATSKRVLTGRNFKLKGAFYPPSHPMSTNQGLPLAGRVVQTAAGPQFRLISGDHYLMEWVPPAPSMGPSFPTAQMLV